MLNRMRLAVRLGLFRYAYLADIPPKGIKQVCHFKENNWQYCCQWSNLGFQENIRILKVLSTMQSQLFLNTFLMRLIAGSRPFVPHSCWPWATIDDNIECNFLILYIELCQYLKYLHGLINEYFLSDQCMMILQKPFKVKDRSVDFNVTEY